MESAMLLNLNQIGQIGLPSSDIERTEAFYGGVLGLRKLYRFSQRPRRRNYRAAARSYS
jgi:catechol 2,3-dioxygenase-like lactoylglutathione lyase family enzyme